MPRPKKIISDVPEAPKRRGRPPKNKLAAATPAPVAKAASKKPTKYSQPSTLTFRIDGKLRIRLKKAAKSEYTSESSLVNKYIEIGLSTEPHRMVLMERRLAIVEKTLGIVVTPEAELPSEDVGDDAGAVSDSASDEDLVDEDLVAGTATTTPLNGSKVAAPSTEYKPGPKAAESKQT